MKELVFKPIAGRTEDIIDAILQTEEVASCTKQLYAIHLVCEELVVNVVSYAYPEGVEGYLKIQIEKADGYVTLNRSIRWKGICRMFLFRWKNAR